jgi:hypothetical protein
LSLLLTSANSPLPFIPYPGPITLDKREIPTTSPITLDRMEIDATGPINLFDAKPHQNPKSPQGTPPVQESSSLEPLEEVIKAPVVKDTEAFNFDWPSEEIKRACEELFPGTKEWTLPALNWIAPEDKTQGDGSGSDIMQDIQHN